MSDFKCEDAYSEGYAIPLYGISDKHDWWRFRNEDFKTTKGITLHFRKEWPCGMAKIEDVRKGEFK